MWTRLLTVCLLFPALLAAQKDSIPLVRSFGVAFENDFMAVPVFGGSDYYYTGGHFLALNLPVLQKNPVSKILLKLPHGRNESFGITLSQLGYTPTSIQSDYILLGDRPFCGTLYVGLNRVSCNRAKQLRLTAGTNLGVIGPYAGVHETQKFIHAHTNNQEPHGWQFQIANDVYANYALKLEKGFVSAKFVELIGYGVANAGTIYTNAGAGLKLRTGKMQPYFTPPVYADRLQLWGQASAEGKVIARDATLQGGLFNRSSPYVVSAENIRRTLFLVSFGIVMAYHRMRIEYYTTYITPEFNGGKHHEWGHVGIQYIF